jgi:hypothetical protein
MLEMRSWVALPLLLASWLGSPLPAASQSPSPSPSPSSARPSKSVRGTLKVVDKRLNGVAMTTEDGKRLAWRFNPAVIAEVAKLPIGAPMIVIYRQIGNTDKRVTAVAFPGTAPTPIYVNLTGSRIVLRSAPFVGDSCTTAPSGQVTESVVAMGGRAEVLEGCWCCAPLGTTCIPGNKSGQGQAFLESCFE